MMFWPISEAFAAGNRAVLVAPPGAGKTTLVPLSLLDAEWLGTGKIVLLEPRRLAARAAARRMAALLGEEVGGTVGYAMRFERRLGRRTRIEVVTEGVLTRRLQRDPSLEGYGLVIFDEFHERSLDADLGLALCLEAQAALRPGFVFIDIGANVGAYSLFVGQRTCPPARILAVEPHPEAQRRLACNLALNGLGWVETVPVALRAPSETV